MKITILQENLLRVLKDVSFFVPSSPPLSILENILIVVEKNSLKAVATDLSIGIQKKTRAKVKKEGKTCVNAKNILSFVSQLLPGKVEIFLDKNMLVLKTGENQAAFNTFPPEEFPLLEENKKQQKTAKKELDKIAKQVAYAAATEDTRAVLTGVKIEKKGERERAIATDGFRLSIVETEGKLLKNGKEEIIIPARLFSDLIRIIPEEEDVFIGMGKEKGRIVLSWADTLVNAQLIEGKFPDFEKIIPQQFTTRAVIEKEGFEHMVRTAAIFARESANIVRLVLKKDIIEVSANSPQIGSNRSKYAAQTEGEEQRVAFNNRFLLDFLKSVEGKDVVFETSGPLKPGVFKDKDKTGDLHIIMPVRVQEEK